MDNLEDQHVMNGHESHLPLAEKEQEILELYDKLQELRLEIAIINSRQSHEQGGHAEPSEEEVKTAQHNLLKARARYKLRNGAVEAVMTAKPVLEAVHDGTEASPVERDLLPYIERRDSAAIAVAKQATTIGDVRSELNRVQSEALRASRGNVDLTAELLDLAEQVKAKRAGRVDNLRVRNELQKLGEDVRSSRQRWRIMKGVAGGIVAGSGMDWARNDELRNMVLDPEDEDKL